MVNEKDLPEINAALLRGCDVCIWLDEEKRVCIAAIDPEDEDDGER